MPDFRCDGGDVGDELVVCGPVELSSVAQADAYPVEAQEVAYGQRHSLALVEWIRHQRGAELRHVELDVVAHFRPITIDGDDDDVGVGSECCVVVDDLVEVFGNAYIVTSGFIMNQVDLVVLFVFSKVLVVCDVTYIELMARVTLVVNSRQQQQYRYHDALFLTLYT